MKPSYEISISIPIITLIRLSINLAQQTHLLIR